MKKGFTLIEVLIALSILMICFIAFAKMYLVGIQSNAYGERLTRATILGNAKLYALSEQPHTASDFYKGWHQDKDNPLRDSGIAFSRFWSVADRTDGKEVLMFVVWGDNNRARVPNFNSLEQLQSSKCPWIDLREIFLNK